MAKIKRIVSTGFWEDKKVTDEFSVEDRYFMLYLLTNPHTTQLGIYELPIKTMSNETGYNYDVVRVLLDRFENKYGVIRYSHSTGEIAIKNYLKHSIVKGGKPVYDCLVKEAKMVSDRSLLSYISDLKDIDNVTIIEFIDYINKEIEKENDNDNDNDNERIVNDSSKKKSTKETQGELLTRLVATRTLSEPLVNKLYEWIAYKQEKGNTYKERGLNALLTQLETKEHEYGSAVVIELINTCMGRNYQGIIFDLLDKKNTPYNKPKSILEQLWEV